MLDLGNCPYTFQSITTAIQRQILSVSNQTTSIKVILHCMTDLHPYVELEPQVQSHDVCVCESVCECAV